MRRGLDPLKLIMSVMVVATLAAGAWGGYHWRRLGGLKSKVSRQIAMLHEADAEAHDEELLRLIRVVREQESRQQQGGPRGLDNFLVLKAVNLKLSPDIKSLGVQVNQGIKQESYRLTFTGTSVRDLVRYLVELLKDWPGLKIDRMELGQYNNTAKRWGNVLVEVSYYTRV